LRAEGGADRPVKKIDKIGRKDARGWLRCALPVTTFAAAVLFIWSCGFFQNGGKPVIKTYDGQWQSIRVNNAIVQFIIEQGYGYTVEAVEMTSHEMQEAMETGEINLNMEMWQQGRMDWYSEQIEKGNIVNLGMSYEAGPQFFSIPKWVAEQHHIETIFDMEQHWRLFKDPQDTSKGIFYNCIIGWRCDEINQVKLEAYGLTRYYNIFSPGSSAAMEAAFEGAWMNHQPVFGYFWAPTALMGKYDWHILKEPPYTDQCWRKISAAIKDRNRRPIDQACAYENLPVEKVVHKSLLKNAQDVVEMLKKMVVGLEPLNQTLAWAKENDRDLEEVAVYYMKNYEDRWRSWVTPNAYKRIAKALRQHLNSSVSDVGNLDHSLALR
jgi:glycine betaine/proline transport system substrate-binding protein